MNQETDRNIKKEVQLKHTKQKLHGMLKDKSHKKDNLVKNLKNLMKREKRV